MVNKCKDLKADGDPCNNNALVGSEYCRFHGPDNDKVAQATQELEAYKPPVKQIVRYVSKDNTAQEGSWKNEWIEDYLSQYLSDGYEMTSAYPFEANQFGIGMIYVLTLKDA
jgi:hypothetical protein